MGFLALAAIVAALALGLLLRRELQKRRKAQASLAETQATLASKEADLAAIQVRFAGALEAEAAEAEAKARTAEIEAEGVELSAKYRERKGVYDRLVAELAIVDERLSFAEMGVYEPHFDFDDSDAFKAAISDVRADQKSMISAKTAVVCPMQWQVEGSVAKGRAMTNRNIRLTLRAFNNECDAAIANVRWNNAVAMEKRVTRAFEQINTLNESLAVKIVSRFLDLKIKELRLTHEYREKLKQEREERAELARLAREEQRLLRDLEQAEAEEARYAALLQRAKIEAAEVVGPQLDAFSEQIATLERDLAEAHAKAERAKAMAERTKCGYVYIISNLGSFGEGVVKIGLTRRLDPLDRVRELGDASVPFVFDTHAVIYSEDAPALEHALHAEFDAARINAQNYRKEFFRVSLDEVEAAVARLAPEASFFKDIEAQEYRETLS